MYLSGRSRCAAMSASTRSTLLGTDVVVRELVFDVNRYWNSAKLRSGSARPSMLKIKNASTQSSDVASRWYGVKIRVPGTMHDTGSGFEHIEQAS